MSSVGRHLHGGEVLGLQPGCDLLRRRAKSKHWSLESGELRVRGHLISFLPTAPFIQASALGSRQISSLTAWFAYLVGTRLVLCSGPRINLAHSKPVIIPMNLNQDCLLHLSLNPSCSHPRLIASG